MLEHLKFYLSMIGHILIDGLFLIAWAGAIYVIHYRILPLFHFSGIMEWLLYGIAYLMDVCIGIPVIFKTIKDTWNEVRHIINGKLER